MTDEWVDDCTHQRLGRRGPRAASRPGPTLGVLPIAVMSSTTGGQAKAIGELFEVYRLSKEAQLDDDIRLLGRVLGDVVREQAGDRVFDLVERVRRLAVAVYRDGADDAELVDLLRALEVRDALERRARLLLLLLAGQHRRGRPVRAALAAHRIAGFGPQPGSVAAALDRLAADGVAGRRAAPRVLDRLLGEPGDHRPPHRGRAGAPCSTPAGGRRPADRRATAPQMSPDEQAAWDAELRVHVLTLWQTAILRLSRLRVRDEINEALRYYDLTPVRRDRSTCRRRRALSWPRAGRPSTSVAAAADPHGVVDRRRPRRQPVRDRRGRCAWPSRANADDGAGPPPRRARAASAASCRCRRRLITPTRGARRAGRRLAATTRRSAPTSRTGGRCGACTPGWRRRPACSLGEVLRPPHCTPHARAVRARPAELLADLAVVIDVAAQPRRRRARPTRPWSPGAPRRRSCSASTCAPSTCARTPTCTSRSSPTCCARAGLCRPTTSSARRGRAGGACWRAELGRPTAGCASPARRLRATHRRRAGHPRRPPPTAPRRFGPPAPSRTTIISKCESVSDVLEVAAAAGARSPPGRSDCARHRAAVRDDRRPRRAGDGDGGAARRPGLPPTGSAAAAGARR